MNFRRNILAFIVCLLTGMGGADAAKMPANRAFLEGKISNIRQDDYKITFQFAGTLGTPNAAGSFNEYPVRAVTVVLTVPQKIRSYGQAEQPGEMTGEDAVKFLSDRAAKRQPVLLCMRDEQIGIPEDGTTPMRIKGTLSHIFTE